MSPKLADQQTAAPAPSRPTTPTAPVNAEQAKAWDGDEGRYWAEHADAFDASLRAHQPLFMAAAAVGPGESVLDIGCGTGQVALDAARAGATVVGVDLSGPMLDVARARAADAGLGNVEFLQADAQVHPFETASFDAVLGRTSAMFFGDHAAAFANLARATKPGGRLVLLVWQGFTDNEWIGAILGAMAAGRDLPLPPPGAPGPFSLSDPARVNELLTGAGYDEPELRDVRVPMYFGPTADEATTFMHGLNAWMIRDVDDASRTRALDALATTMREHEGPDGVTFGSATWLITAMRH